MEVAAILDKYHTLQRYIGWQEADAQRVRGAAPVLIPHLGLLVDDFYATIEQFPAALHVITGGPAQIERLKQTLNLWVTDLLTGPYEQDYVLRRWKVGYRHVEIGLDQMYADAALSRMRYRLVGLLEQHWTGGLPELRATLVSLNRLLDLEFAIITSAYQAEFVAKLQLKRRALQAERLAAIGQMITGLAHESRNALQRSQACLDLLTMELEGQTDALELVERVQRSQQHLHHLYEEVRGYAAPIVLHRERCRVDQIWREAWSQLELTTNKKPIQLREDEANLDHTCHADPIALGQVFRNLFENAIDASQVGDEIVVRCSDVFLFDRPAIQISIRDHGPGMNPEQSAQIFEPFYTTKTRGTGLGMAICQRIIDAHGGRIFVGSPDGPGAEIVLVIPRDGK